MTEKSQSESATPTYPPGPYTYVRSEDGCDDTWDIVTDADKSYIASIHFWDDGDREKFREYEPQARLLASAPELVQSLKYLLDKLNPYRFTVTDGEVYLAICAAAYVVGKATGTHYDPQTEWRPARK